MEAGGSDTADSELRCYLVDAETFGADSVELSDDQPLPFRKAIQGFVDADFLRQTKQIFVVVFFLTGFFVRFLSTSFVAMNGGEHHLAAPVAGVCGKAAINVLVVAQGCFAQSEASFLPQVVQRVVHAAPPFSSQAIAYAKGMWLTTSRRQSSVSS